jgi:PST family polysaccharide transporter
MAKRTNAGNYSARMQQLLTGMALLGYAVAIPATCLSQKIVHLVFGSQFDGAAPSLIVLAWAGVFVGIGVARESWLITEGLMKFSLIYTAIGAVTNIALNLALIPQYGSVGSSTATLISYATAGFAAGFLNPKTRPVAVMTFKALTLQSLFVRSIAGASPIVPCSDPQMSSDSELSQQKPLEVGA